MEKVECIRRIKCDGMVNKRDVTDFGGRDGVEWEV